METFHARNYNTRAELENHIKEKVGLNTTANEEEGHIISGTKKELKKLQLSSTTTIWGVKCKMTGSSVEKDLKKKVETRGKIWKE